MTRIREWFKEKPIVTLETLVGDEQVTAVLLFEGTLTYREAQIARQAWEKGLEQGRALASNQESRSE